MIVPYWLRTFFLFLCLCAVEKVFGLFVAPSWMLWRIASHPPRRGEHLFTFFVVVVYVSSRWFFFLPLHSGWSRKRRLDGVSSAQLYISDDALSHTHTLIMLLSTTLSTSFPLHFFFFSFLYISFTIFSRFGRRLGARNPLDDRFHHPASVEMQRAFVKLTLYYRNLKLSLFLTLVYFPVFFFSFDCIRTLNNRNWCVVNCAVST